MSRVSCGVPTQLDLIIRSLPRSSKDWRDQMTQLETELDGPDFTQGVKISTVPDGTMLLGHIRGEAVLLVRRGDEVFAIGAFCTHYGAPWRRPACRRHSALPLASCVL